MNTLILTGILTIFLNILPSGVIAAKAEAWEGKYYKRGVSAQCASFVGAVVKSTGRLPPKGYEKCTNWNNWGIAVAIRNRKRGDIIIYSKSGRYNHIGIYDGRGKIIHRPTRSRPVQKLKYNYRRILAVRRG